MINNKFKAATQATASERLAEKFRPKTYFESMRVLFHVVYGTSFLFNVLSATTASALIYLFLQSVLPVIPAVILTGALLFALEATKRLTASRLFIAHVTGRGMDFLAIVVVAMLSGASIASSFKGAEKLVVQYTAPAVEADRSELNQIEGSIAEIDRQIREQQANGKYKGQLTYHAARTIDRLTKQRSGLQEEAITERARVREENTTAKTEHKATTITNAHYFALFTLACELMFLFAAYWLEYYDYRSYVEMNEAGTRSQLHPHATMHPSPIVAAISANKSDRNPVTMGRSCNHCGTAYEARHAKQKFCSDRCRLGAWHAANGRPVNRNAAG